MNNRFTSFEGGRSVNKLDRVLDYFGYTEIITRKAIHVFVLPDKHLSDQGYGRPEETPGQPMDIRLN